MTEIRNNPKMGRPAYEPSDGDRMAVEEMVFCGETQNTIARALGIDIKTLVKHFPEELAGGYANRRREILGLLFEAARKGNIAAQKKLEELGRVRIGAGSSEERDARPEAMGKKEQRQAAAEAVTGKYAPPAGPRLVVRN